MIGSPDLQAAHDASFGSRRFIRVSRKAGCFCCLARFPARAVVEFTGTDHTPICPKCGVDSVILDATGWRPTRVFLTRMEARWFGELRRFVKREGMRG